MTGPNRAKLEQYLAGVQPGLIEDEIEAWTDVRRVLDTISDSLHKMQGKIPDALGAKKGGTGDNFTKAVTKEVEALTHRQEQITTALAELKIVKQEFINAKDDLSNFRDLGTKPEPYTMQAGEGVDETAEQHKFSAAKTAMETWDADFASQEQKAEAKIKAIDKALSGAIPPVKAIHGLPDDFGPNDPTGGGGGRPPSSQVPSAPGPGVITTVVPLCPHGNAGYCRKCHKAGPTTCIHGNDPDTCRQCNRVSNTCQHGMNPSTCPICHRKTTCPHGNDPATCRQCHGARLCPHGNVPTFCRQCHPTPPPNTCIHGNPPGSCPQCNSPRTCIHGNPPGSCPQCNPSHTCIHGNPVGTCQLCRRPDGPTSNVVGNPNSGVTLTSPSGGASAGSLSASTGSAPSGFAGGGMMGSIHGPGSHGSAGGPSGGLHGAGSAPGIGASARSGAGGALGRPGAAGAAGGASARGGAAGGRGGAAGGASGGRGGRGGRGGAGGAGGRGNRKGKSGRKDPGSMFVEEEWLGDEDTAPGVID